MTRMFTRCLQATSIGTEGQWPPWRTAERDFHGGHSRRSAVVSCPRGLAAQDPIGLAASAIAQAPPLVFTVAVPPAERVSASLPRDGR